MIPIERPGKIICVGLNYKDHAEEQGVELPKAPLFFAKYTTTLIGPGDPIVIPPVVQQCDYEAELGVVMGTTVSRIGRESAMEAIAGYVVANDVSARDLQFADGQWTRGKSPDTFCPVGPLVPASPSLPEWDARALAAIEALLLPQLGPMTRLVVRNGARRCHDMPGLVAWLAAEVVEPDERSSFIAQAHKACPMVQSAAKSAPSGPIPVLGTTPMQADLVDKAQRVLAEQIGPIAAVLVRRAAATSRTREAFFAALADAAGTHADRKQLLAQLWRLR